MGRVTKSALWVARVLAICVAIFFGATLLGWRGLPPPAPTGFTATAEQAGIYLSWNASSGATDYTLSYKSPTGSWTNLGTTSTTHLNFAAYSLGVTPPFNNVQYSFEIYAWNSYGDSSTVTTAGMCTLGPAGISGTLSGSNIHITWSAVTYAGLTSYPDYGYYVQKSTSGALGSWTAVGYIASSGPYQLGVAIPSSTTYYRVLTANESGFGPPSNMISSDGSQVSNQLPPYLVRHLTHPHGRRYGALSSDPVDLATGAENYAGAPDITVYNPNGPGVEWRRMYSTEQATTSNGSPGMTPGWSHGYDYTIQANIYASGWANLHLFYPNGSSELLTPVLSGGSPTGAFTLVKGAQYMVSGVASGTTGQWTSITMTRKDRSQLTFTLFGGGRYVLSTIANRMGQSVSLNYDTNRELTSVVDNTSSTTLLSLSYTSGVIQSATDATGSTSRSVYYGSAVAAGGLGQTELTSVSQIVSTGTSSPPNLASYAYVPYGAAYPDTYYAMLSTITVPSASGTGNATATINYNPSGKVSSVVDGNGNQEVYTYNSSSTEIQAENSSSTVIFQQTDNFDSSLRNTGSTDANGEANHLACGDTNNPFMPTSYTDEDSLETQFTYDSYGNIETVETPKGTTTTYTYSYSNFALGECTQVQQGSKTPLSATYYEPSGLVETVTTPIPGNVGSSSTQTSTFTYTSMGDLSEVQTPGNNSVTSHTTTYNYTTDGTYSQAEHLGQALTITSTLSNTTHLRYDSYGNIASETDPNSNEYQNLYNLANQQTEVENPATGQTGTGNSYTLNTYLYPDGPLEETQLYDESATLSRTVSYNYGNEGELLSLGGDQLATTYTYDAMYHPLTVEDGNSHTTSYSYNTVGELTEVTNPDSTTVQYDSYDNAHKLLQRIDANSVTTNYTYGDGDGLLSAIAYPATTSLNVSLSYDSYDRLTSASDGSGSYSYSFDDLDEPITDDTTYTGQSAVDLSYSYYPDRALETTTTGVGDFDYGYDGDGRLTELTNPNSEVTAWTYQNNAWPTQESVGGGLYSANYAYNAMGQLTTLTNENSSSSVLSEFSSISHDAPGNILSATHSVPGETSLSGSLTNTYDTIDQLASSDSTRSALSYSQSYVADSAGNLTTLRGSTVAYTNRNEINATGYSYDSNGNPTTYAGASTTWDPENRMTAFGSAGSYGYRYDGLRASKTVGSTTTYFIYDLTGMPLMETQGGSVSAFNTFGPNGLISRDSSSTVYYLFDERGNTVSRMNSSGSAIDYHGSDPYGQQYASASSSDPFQGFGAQWGYYYDAETGYSLLGHRYFDPAYSRFLNQDPIGFNGGINVYSYADNNPIVGIDPSGLDPGTNFWYDQLSGLASRVQNAAKGWINNTLTRDPIFGVMNATAADTAVDVVAGFFQAPAKLGHYGEGFGAYAGDPGCRKNQYAFWDDLGTTCAIGTAMVGGFEYMNRPYWRYVGPTSNPTFAADGTVLPGAWVSRTAGYGPPYGTDFELAKDQLSLPSMPNNVIPVNVPWDQYAGWGRAAKPVESWGTGGGPEYRVGGY